MPFFIDVFHGFYRTAIVPTFIDIVPFLINIVPTNNLFLIIAIEGFMNQSGYVSHHNLYHMSLCTAPSSGMYLKFISQESSC